MHTSKSLVHGCCRIQLEIVGKYLVLDLDVGRLARSQNPEGPATGHLDPGFLGFPGS